MQSWLAKVLCAVALLACASLAHAQIYRCVGAHGEPVFSGQSCGGSPMHLRADGVPDSGNAMAGTAVPFGNACPASPQAVRTSINDAFQTHDVNRLAGLIVWRGIGQSSARAMLRALADWLQQPLTGVSIAYSGAGPPLPKGAPVYADSPGDSPDDTFVATQTPTGMTVSTGGGAGRTRYFGLTESEGCWWLTF